MTYGFTVSDIPLRFHETWPHVPLYQAPAALHANESVLVSGNPMLRSFALQDELVGMSPDRMADEFMVSDIQIRFHENCPHVPLYQVPTALHVNESVLASGNATLTGFAFQDEPMGMAPKIKVSDIHIRFHKTCPHVSFYQTSTPKTTDYGRVDTFPTVFRIQKAAGQEVTINPYGASAEATPEISEIAGQSLPKYASVVAPANLIAIEGEGGNASPGLVIDSTIGLKDTSLDLKSLGTGTGIEDGPAIGVGPKYIRSGPVMMNGPGFWDKVGDFFIQGGLNMARNDMKGAKRIADVVGGITGKTLPGFGQDNALYRPEFNK